MKTSDLPDGFRDMQSFGLVEALLGRRSRRFFKGAEIPDGVLKFKSRFEPMPLTELEKLLVVAACGGNTAWHHMIFRADRYAPHLSNYAAAAGGRTFPSSAGFHTSMTFFTDDEGVYVLDARDAPAFAERAEDGSLDPGAFLEAMRGRVKSSVTAGCNSLPRFPTSRPTTPGSSIIPARFSSPPWGTCPSTSC